MVTKLWARRYDDKNKRYEYKVMWAGLPSSEASYVAEDQISAPRLMEDFDARCPRGSTRTDKNEDIAAYLRAKPGLAKFPVYVIYRGGCSSLIIRASRMIILFCFMTFLKNY